MRLKIVYVLTRRLLGLVMLLSRGDRAEEAELWYFGTRTQCYAGPPAGSGTNPPTGPGSLRWPRSSRGSSGPGSSR
jgi:hypothetical protein